MFMPLSISYMEKFFGSLWRGIKTFLFFLICLTWGILQNLIGFITFLFLAVKPHYRYKGSIVTIVKGRWGGISLGAFIFIDEDIKKEAAPTSVFVNHERGHCIQSIILGPLYLFVIGLSSMIWAGFFDGYRQRKGVSYYDFYTERGADKLGGIETSSPSGYRFVVK